MSSKTRFASVLIAVLSFPFVCITAFSRSDAPEISTTKLHDLIAEQNAAEERAKAAGTKLPEPSFVVVDVRSEAEVKVSLIPGAITKTQYKQNQNAYAGRTVIAYCTVGYRSGIYARKLSSMGITAMNFKDSILGWCEQQHSLVTPEGKPTNRVHVYSSQYSVPSNYTPVL